MPTLKSLFSTNSSTFLKLNKPPLPITTITIIGKRIAMEIIIIITPVIVIMLMNKNINRKWKKLNRKKIKGKKKDNWNSKRNNKRNKKTYRNSKKSNN
jgi:predicted glycosyl hydrolase (DUF1957 family)